MNTPKRKRNFSNDLNGTPSPKRCRVMLSIKQKVELINASEAKPPVTQQHLADKFGISRSSVADIIKRKDFYRDQLTTNANTDRHRCTSGSKYGDLNSLLHQWFGQARAKNMPISGPILQEKAMQFAKELGHDEFKASNGWLESWKIRYSIKFYKICGESGDVDMEKVNDFRDKLPELIQGTDLKDVFNCDETGLFFRALPDKSLSHKRDACKGGKLAKERLTVMLACSATGEKLKPMIIGKAHRPRCFKNVNVEKLPCTWRSNKRAWMTDATFTDWIVNLNKDMTKQKRHSLMFLDNATSHAKNLKLSNVELRFLPANTTSKLQPLDLGIIRAFKARYRKHLMRHLVANMEKCDTVTELTKKLSVLDAVFWISKAWDETKPETISKCFRDAGFTSQCTQETPDEEVTGDDDDDDDIPLADLLRRHSLYSGENVRFIVL